MNENFNQETKEKASNDNTSTHDTGMKWVYVAYGLMLIVVALLLSSTILMRHANEMEENRAYRQETSEAPEIKETQEFEENTLSKNYDFDLKLTPQDCNNINGNVDIVLITDANYMDFTRVAIQSAKETKCPDSQYNFYIMTMDISNSDEAALKALEAPKVTVSILPQQEIDLFYIRDTHVSKTSLLKYYIARALPNLEKVLYIDSDVLILHDLTKLYQTDISDVYLAAVKDPSWFFENTHVLELNLEDRGFYFNSGVMLMNLAKFRQDNLLEKLEEYTNNNFRTYMDQDALNVVVKDKVKLLDFENNAINFFFEHIDLDTLGEFYNRSWENFEDVFAPVTILHFASSKKPLGPLADNQQFFRMLQRLWYKYYTPLPPLD